MTHDKLDYRAAVYLTLANIPEGLVITYGQLAQMAGIPRAARLIGTLLRDLPDTSELPWHRVINAQGKISLPVDSKAYHKQKQRLTNEGIVFVNEKINLQIYGYNSAI